MNEADVRLRLACLPAIGCPTARARTGDSSKEPVPAAVLVPIVLGPRPTILLTKRAARLSRHAGQVCFPGGRIEPQDVSAAAAALREATEEIGLDSRAVSLLGRLPEHTSGSGFRITPVVGLVPGSVRVAPAPAEVEAVFGLPLETLLDTAAPLRKVAERDGRLRTFWVWPHPEYEIWGATAAILLSLAIILRQPHTPRPAYA